ncbi:MAG: peptidoglycan DD-metalloendopeptidase family protein [Steroidobacteraceae bacterium]
MRWIPTHKLLPLLALAPLAAWCASSGQTESQLRSVREQIDRISKQIGQDALEKDRASRDLKSAELGVADARSQLAGLRADIAGREQRRTELARNRDREQAALREQRAALAGQLRAAYMIGREEPLRLLLNQHDPQQVGRMLGYYRYFGAARARQIGAIDAHLAKIAELDQQIAAEQQQLVELQKSQQGRLASLEQARSQRQDVLAGLQKESESRSQSLQRLKSQQSSLEKLLRDLRRNVSPALPPDTSSAFGKLRGQLGWPLGGKVVASYGERRAGDVRWDGMVISADRDQPVAAIAAGTVVYADWLPGLGLLVIVDHGEGYLSLYGYTSRIYKKAGERVSAGETIAAAGDTGGRSEPQLYFEIRRGGKPIDPAGWFRSATPR